jgi:hypothetical protein
VPAGVSHSSSGSGSGDNSSINHSTITSRQTFTVPSAAPLPAANTPTPLTYPTSALYNATADAIAIAANVAREEKLKWSGCGTRNAPLASTVDGQVCSVRYFQRHIAALLVTDWNDTGTDPRLAGALYRTRVYGIVFVLIDLVA